MARRGAQSGAAVAQGSRNVAIGGDVTDSIIVTGDNATFHVLLGPESGALLERLRESLRPTKRLRPPPLDARPPPFADRLDRERETAALLEASAGPGPVNLYGEAGLGKTYVVATAANDPASRSLTGGVVYLFAKGKPLDDLVQALFE